MKNIFVLILTLMIIFICVGCNDQQKLDEQTRIEHHTALDKIADEINSETISNDEEKTLEEALYEKALVDPDLADELMVYVHFENAYWYHINKDCEDMMIPISLEYALSKGCIPCLNCIDVNK